MPNSPLTIPNGRYSTPASLLKGKPVQSTYSSMHLVTALEMCHRESEMEDAKLTGMTRCLSSRLRALNITGTLLSHNTRHDDRRIA